MLLLLEFTSFFRGGWRISFKDAQGSVNAKLAGTVTLDNPINTSSTPFSSIPSTVPTYERPANSEQVFDLGTNPVASFELPWMNWVLYEMADPADNPDTDESIITNDLNMVVTCPSTGFSIYTCLADDASFSFLKCPPPLLDMHSYG